MILITFVFGFAQKCPKIPLNPHSYPQRGVLCIFVYGHSPIWGYTIFTKHKAQRLRDPSVALEYATNCYQTCVSAAIKVLTRTQIPTESGAGYGRMYIAPPHWGIGQPHTGGIGKTGENKN